MSYYGITAICSPQMQFYFYISISDIQGLMASLDSITTLQLFTTQVITGQITSGPINIQKQAYINTTA